MSTPRSVWNVYTIVDSTVAVTGVASPVDKEPILQGLRQTFNYIFVSVL